MPSLFFFLTQYILFISQRSQKGKKIYVALVTGVSCLSLGLGVVWFAEEREVRVGLGVMSTVSSHLWGKWKGKLQEFWHIPSEFRRLKPHVTRPKVLPDPWVVVSHCSHLLPRWGTQATCCCQRLSHLPGPLPYPLDSGQALSFNQSFLHTHCSTYWVSKGE